MQSIIIGTWEQDRLVVALELHHARLHFSGGRAVIETARAGEVRRLLRSLPRGFVVEHGRAGLEGCRADRRHSSGVQPRITVTSKMPPTPLPDDVVAFSYSGTYDTAHAETIPPPPSSAAPRYAV